MRHKNILMVLSLALAIFLLLGTLKAIAEPPMLVPGKSTIYQRVIVHPGAEAYSQPGAPRGDVINPFTVLYVYKRQPSTNGADWLLCAPNTLGKDQIWIRSDTTSEWNKSLVLLLSKVNGRKPLMFFKSKSDVIKLAKEENVNQVINTYERQFKDFFRSNTVPPPDFPVVGLEPDFKDGVVPYDHFYLMPIFSYDDTTLNGIKFLEVASIDPGTSEETASLDLNSLTASVSPWNKSVLPSSMTSAVINKRVKRTSDRQIKPMAPMAPSAGSADESGQSINNLYVAFVIDTTVSMAPYIEQCLDISREFYIRILQEQLQDRVSLAVVAYRSSVAASPKTEYTTRIISNFKKASERNSFLQALGRVEEAKFSTHSFSEDSYAGLDKAIYDLDWPTTIINKDGTIIKNNDGKIIILITDAGPLSPSDPWHSTDHTADSIGGLAKSQGINIVPIHVKTNAGEKNHLMAEEAYRTISNLSSGDDSYLDIQAGGKTDSSKTFGTTANTIMLNLEEQIFAPMRNNKNTSIKAGQSPILRLPGKTSSGQSSSEPVNPIYPDDDDDNNSSQVQINDFASVNTQVIKNDMTGNNPPPAPPKNLDAVKSQLSAYGFDEDTETQVSTKEGDMAKSQVPTEGDSAKSQLSAYGLDEDTETQNEQQVLASAEEQQIEPQQAGDSSSAALVSKPIISSGPNNTDPAVLKAAEIGQRLGLSIRLNYLGSINKVSAPQVVRSWITDKDLSLLEGRDGEKGKEVPTVEVAVLLTKNQLSALSAQLKIIMEKAEEGLDTQSKDFFQRILSASAQIANDPQAFSLSPTTSLGDLGVMGEFLSDLPYVSPIMGKTEKDWYNMGFVEQDKFIRVIRSKVDLYAQYDADVNNWARFDENNPGDWLYRVPLSMLP
jgi:hypothetical protein